MVLVVSLLLSILPALHGHSDTNRSTNLPTIGLSLHRVGSQRDITHYHCVDLWYDLQPQPINQSERTNERVFVGVFVLVCRFSWRSRSLVCVCTCMCVLLESLGSERLLMSIVAFVFDIVDLNRACISSQSRRWCPGSISLSISCCQTRARACSSYLSLSPSRHPSIHRYCVCVCVCSCKSLTVTSSTRCQVV